MVLSVKAVQYRRGGSKKGRGALNRRKGNRRRVKADCRVEGCLLGAGHYGLCYAGEDCSTQTI